MKTTATVARWLIGIAGVIQITLGLLFWSGQSLSLLPVHMMLGIGIVLGLWFVAVLAVRAGVSRGFAAFAGLWGLLVVALGMNQGRLLTGDLHWIIQVLHLAVGVAAIGMAEGLAARVKQTQEMVSRA